MPRPILKSCFSYIRHQRSCNNLQSLIVNGIRRSYTAERAGEKSISTSNLSPLITTTSMRFTMKRNNFSSSSLSPENKSKNFLCETLGYDEKIADGVIDALRTSLGSSMTDEALYDIILQMAGRYEVGEDAGLETLVESVRQELSRSEGKKVVQFWCIPPVTDGNKKGDIKNNAFKVHTYEGISITDTAKYGTLEGASTLSEYIECACSGIMACSTCHIIISPENYADPSLKKSIGVASEDEQDMIDLAFSPQPTSRLGCQVTVDKTMDGKLYVQIPSGVNNMMDYIPFEDKS